jgi:anthraniloyl-CoA monooxygenase
MSQHPTPNGARATPPAFPDTWSASYVSYWFPAAPDDQITSGNVWFDYPGQRFRIDGLFNPWDEQTTGHRLWMSETGFADIGQTCKLTMAYHLSPLGYRPAEPAWHVEPLPRELVPQHVLAECGAHLFETVSVLGVEAEAWRFERPGGQGLVTYVFEGGTSRLLRMITGDSMVRASIRDFFNFSGAPLAPALFEPALAALGRSSARQTAPGGATP